MGLVGVIGFFAVIPKMISFGFEPVEIIDKSLDLLTIIVAPALPAAMAAGVAFAISRLRKKEIFCISPPRVNVSGMIQIMVFDKTGTLTEDGLQIKGVRGILEEASDVKFTGFVEDISSLLKTDPQNEKTENKASNSNPQFAKLNQVMACCHAITHVNDEMIGDPLEIKMFEMTKWKLDENYPGSVQLGENILANVVSQEGETLHDY